MMVACGGGQTSEDSLLFGGPERLVQSPSPVPNPGQSPTTTPLPEPTAPPQPTTPPSPVVDPTPTPDPNQPTPTPTPVILSKPSLTVSITANGLRANWNQRSAYEYRVLYYRDDVDMGEYFSAGPSMDLPLNDFGRYMVIVEALDTLGNSLFSDPAYVEVKP